MRRLAVPLLLTLGVLSWLPAAPAQQAAAPAQATFRNPVYPSDFPDPFLLRANGVYYAYATNAGGRDVQLARSDDLVDWQLVGNALGKIGAWAELGFTWAPAVLQVKGGWALYYTARDTASGRQCVGAAFAARPEGPFVDGSDKPFVCQLDLGGTIDAFAYLDRDGQRYLYYKNDGNCCGTATYLWAQRLSPDGRELLGQPEGLVFNDQPWEGNVIENPSVQRWNDTYYLMYSAGPWDTEYYAIGYATGPRPLGPFKKATEPFLRATGDIAGPGGQSVVFDGAGLPWLAFHAWEAGNVGYKSGGSRSLYIGRLSFPNGVPSVRATTERQPVPAVAPAVPAGR